MDILIPIAIIVVAIAVAIVIVVSLRKKYNVSNVYAGQSAPKDFNLQLKKPYMELAELKFLEILNRVLPSECIAFPKVAVNNLVEPKGDKLGYNAISGNSVDICIFLIKTMEPILVIDLADDNTLSKGLKVLEPNVIKALNAVKIPVLKYTITDKIDREDLKTKILKSIKNDILVQFITKK